MPSKKIALPAFMDGGVFFSDECRTITGRSPDGRIKHDSRAGIFRPAIVESGCNSGNEVCTFHETREAARGASYALTPS
jgi:hypothetical protein